MNNFYTDKAQQHSSPPFGVRVQITPRLNVDIIIELDNDIVLIRRKNPPYGWALPGGFVDIGECTLNAAHRKANEETGLILNYAQQLHTYSDPNRDPRGHIVSVVYVAKAKGIPVAADDAREVKVLPIDEAILLNDLCFDCGKILKDYIRFKATGHRPFFD